MHHSFAMNKESFFQKKTLPVKRIYHINSFNGWNSLQLLQIPSCSSISRELIVNDCVLKINLWIFTRSFLHLHLLLDWDPFFTFPLSLVCGIDEIISTILWNRWGRKSLWNDVWVSSGSFSSYLQSMFFFLCTRRSFTAHSFVFAVRNFFDTGKKKTRFEKAFTKNTKILSL